MREAGGAAGDVRTAGSVERLEDEEARGGQRAGWQVSSGRNLNGWGVRKMNMSGGGERIGRGSDNGGGGSAAGRRGRGGCGRSHYRRLEALDRNGVNTRAKTKSEKVRRRRKHLIGARINWSQGRSGCISANENVRSLEKGGRK